MKNHVALVDSRTAAALAQILPVLLLTLAVELRRTKLHRRLSRGRRRLMAFFVIFGLIETTLVLHIDGAIYPFQWFDIFSALTIFGLLSIIFWVTFSNDDGSPDN